MKKILMLSLALVMFGSLTSGVAYAQSGSTLDTVSLQCVQTAVATRESAIGGAFTVFSTSITNALSARAAALNTAWGMTDGVARRAARNTAWEDYKKSSQTAKTTFKTSKRAAWDAFKTASKACRVPVVETETKDNLTL